MVCPACIASAAAVVGSVTSGGGMFAFVVARIRKFTGSRKLSQERQAKEKQS